jgi:hypothetical protein
MSELIPTENVKWAIGARHRSQKLLLALSTFDDNSCDGRAESPEAELFSILVAVAYSLWRAAFLADAPTRTWPQALSDARKLLQNVLRTNTITFVTEHNLQGWTAGFYLKNAKLRLEQIFRGRLIASDGARYADDEALARVERIVLVGTDPHVTWDSLCEEAERLSKRIGCEIE